MSRYVIDTCVIIYALKPYGKATLEWINKHKANVWVPSIVDIEFYAGCKSQDKQERYVQLIKILQFASVGRQEIRRAATLIRKSAQGPGAVDAIVGVTAKAFSATVATFNTKHFIALGVRCEAPPQ